LSGAKCGAESDVMPGIEGRLLCGFCFKLADAFEKKVPEEYDPLGTFGLFHALHRATQAGEHGISGQKLRCSMRDHLSGPFGSDFGGAVRRCLDR
jgi:hypothetical protein